MCAGTLYWANIGPLIYGMDERRLLALTGNHLKNPTLQHHHRRSAPHAAFTGSSSPPRAPLPARSC